MQHETIHISYRACDAENRSYSLLERLDAGKFLLRDPENPKELSAYYLFLNALLVTFHTNLFHNSLFHGQNRIPLRKLDHFSLRVGGWWNLYAWIEALTLFWLNWATNRYNPLQDSWLSTMGSQIHIAVAGLFHALAKTLNLIGTPLTLLLITFAGMAFGFTPLITAFTVLAVTSKALSIAYHYKKIESVEGDDHKMTALWRATLFSVKNLLAGLFQSFLRMTERARDLYHTHPYLFWASAFVVTLSVLSFAVFPYVGAPTILGFKLGGFVYHLLEPLLTSLSDYFTLTEIESTVFKTSVTFFSTLGVVDLVTRSFKEIGGWLNVFRALEVKPISSPSSPPLAASIQASPIKQLMTDSYTPFLVKYDATKPNKPTIQPFPKPSIKA